MNKKDLQKVDQIQYKKSRKYIEMSGKGLAELAKGGDSEADKELQRRKKKKAKKTKKI